MHPALEKFKEKVSRGKKCQPKTPSTLSGVVELGSTKREGSGPLSEDSPPNPIPDNHNITSIDDEPSERVQPDLNTTPQAPLEPASRPPIPENTPSPSLLLIGTLWKDAVDILEKKDREKVDLLLSKQGVEGIAEEDKESPPHDGPPAIVNSILSKAEKIKEDKKGAWTPAIDKIITGVLRFKSLGDAAVKFDKSGYAALGWSVLSFGLQVADNEKGARECAISSIEFITDFMARYAEYEKLSKEQAQPDGKFDHQLVQVYKAILLYLVALDEYLCQRGPERYARAICEPRERAIQKGKDAIVSADAQAQAWLPIVTFRMQKDNFATLLEKSKTQLLPKPSPQIRNCLTSLAFLEMENRPKDIVTAAASTCEWLSQHKTYREWIGFDRSLLWIKGKPGSGKSTLLRYALDNVMVAANIGANAFVLSFFFDGRGVELQKTPLGLFRSLLHQLLSRVPDKLPKPVATFEKHCSDFGEPGKDWQWSLAELQGLFESSLAKLLEDRPIWLFVDALDESGKENAVRLVGKLKSLVGRLQPTKFPFRICFSCRHYPILGLDCDYEICLERENENAIAAFVNHQLSGFSRRTSSAIPALIISRANGIFLWASLMVDRVLDHERDGDGMAAIEAEICSIPPDLYRLYRELLRGMTPDSLKLVQWICFATRPLSLEELRWVMVIDADCPYQSLRECQSAEDFPSTLDMVETRLKRLTCGLAEAVPSSEAKVVQFIHQSVRDFFIDQGLSILTGSSKWLAHCIRQSARDLPKTFQGILVEKGLSVLHVSPNIAATLIGLAAVFVLYMDCFMRGHRSFLPDRAFPLPAVLATVTTFWLHEASIRGAKARFAVGTAHYRLSRTCVRYLAMEEIGIGRSSDDDRNRLKSEFPFLHYVTTSWVEHVQQSEENGISQGDLLDYFSWPSERLIHLWIWLHGRLDINLFPGGRTDMIHIASNYKFVEPLRIIFQRAAEVGADIDKRSWGGRTPLWYAARAGHVPAVQELLSRGAKIDHKDTFGMPPLSIAAFAGHEVIVQLLLDHGANIETADIMGFTPLMYAASRRREVVMQQLLDRGAKVDVVNTHDRRTPLIYSAFWAKDKAIVHRLLDRGSGVDTADKSGRTALSYASEKGNEVMVHQLLDRGAKVDAADERGRTPLSYAVEEGHEAIVQQLLGRLEEIRTT